MSTPEFHSDVFDFVRSALGPGDIDDARLLDRFVSDHDRSAFELIVRRHLETVRRSCFVILRDHHLAEDCAQAVFLTLARKASTIRNREALIGWLTRVARRIAFKAIRLRRSKGLPTTVGVEEAASRTNDSDPGIREAEAILHEEVDRLPDKYRLPILLCYFEGLTHEEAADRLGWKLGSLNTRVLKARSLLEMRMTRRGVAGAGLGALSSQLLPPATGEFIGQTITASILFAAGQGSIPGISPLARQLTSEVLRTMFIAKQLKVAAGLALCGLFLIAGIVWIGVDFKNDEEKKAAIAISPTQQTLRSTPPTNATPAPPLKEINAKTIDEFRKSGAMFGPIHLGDEFGDNFTFKGGTSNKVEPKEGLPGFSWMTGTWENDLSKLPKVEAPFGIVLRIRDSDATRTNEFLKLIAAQENLTALQFMADGLTDEGLEGIVAFQNLSWLEVQSWKLTDAGMKSLAALKNLKKLHLRANPTGAGLRELAPLQKLTSFTFTAHKMSDEDAKALTVLQNLDTLILVDARLLTDAGVKNLASMKNLTSLELGCPSVTDVGVKELVALNKLKRLYLGSSLVTNEGIRELGKLNNLTTLTLMAPKLADGGARELAKLKNLTTLILYQTKVTDNGAKCLADLTNLSELTLEAPDLTDAGLKNFVALKRLNKLSLTRSPRLTMKGAKELTQLTNLTSLTVFLKCTPKEKQELQKAMPNCKIEGF